MQNIFDIIMTKSLIILRDYDGNIDIFSLKIKNNLINSFDKNLELFIDED